jgi:hypothetical protein
VSRKLSEFQENFNLLHQEKHILRCLNKVVSAPSNIQNTKKSDEENCEVANSVEQPRQELFPQWSGHYWRLKPRINQRHQHPSNFKVILCVDAHFFLKMLQEN